MIREQAIRQATEGGATAHEDPRIDAPVAVPDGVLEHYAQRSAATASGGGTGAPLPDGVRAKMESSFDADFSDVRVHLDGQSEQLGALAFAQGSQLHFAAGQYAPESSSGQELIGHELAHVQQQRAGRVAVPQGKGAPINDDPALEAEADRLGALAARGEPARLAGARGPSPRAAAIQGKIRFAPGTASERIVDKLDAWVELELLAQVQTLGGDVERAKKILHDWLTDNQIHDGGNEHDLIAIIVALTTDRSDADSKKRKLAENQKEVREQHQKPLSKEELQEVKKLKAYGNDSFGGKKSDVAYGEADPDVYEHACFNFALSGGSTSYVRPEPLFQMLGNSAAHFEEAFGTVEDSVDHIIADLTKDGPEKEWYLKHRDRIVAMRKKVKTKKRKKAAKVEAVEAVKREALSMLLEANGLQPCEPDESVFSIAMESKKDDDVEFTHFGVNVEESTFETNPSYGVWHTTKTFEENWKDDGSITTVGVKELNPKQNEHIRGFLRMHGTSQWASAKELEEQTVDESELTLIFSSNMAEAIRAHGAVDSLYSDKEGRCWQLKVKGTATAPYKFARRVTMDH